MNGLEFLSEKIGRKQLICITGMIILQMADAVTWQIMAVAFGGIVAQFIIDWRKPRAAKVNPPAS
jgi:hypothetical protein